jgi:hypothetical protein
MTDLEELFTMKLWREALDENRVEWRGKIQHIGSGEAQYFRDLSAVMDFIHKNLPELSTQQPSESEEVHPDDHINDEASRHGGLMQRLLEMVKRVVPLDKLYDRLSTPNSDKWRSFNSLFTRFADVSFQVTSSAGFIIVGTISFILGREQIATEDPKTTSAISGIVALLLTVMYISQKLQSYRRRLTAGEEI